jgi:hypothetical protein
MTQQATFVRAIAIAFINSMQALAIYSLVAVEVDRHVFYLDGENYISHGAIGVRLQMELGFLDCFLKNADAITKTAIFTEFVDSGFVDPHHVR